MTFKLFISIILVSLLLAAALLGYRLFLAEPDQAALVLSNTNVLSQGLSATGQSGNDPERAEFARLLRVISRIDKLDAGVFTSAVFRSLVLFDFPIPNPTPGRANPFAPIGLP